MSESIFKILVFGASGVGKTSLLSNIAKYFYKESTQKDAIIKNVSYVFRKNKNIGILGLDYLLKGFRFADKEYRFHFWDLKGDEDLDNLTNYYFKESAGALVIFDLSRLETFHAALEYIKIIKKLKCPFGVIGTKADLVKPDELITKSDINKKITMICKEGSYFYSIFSSNSFEKSEDYSKEIKAAIEIFLGKIINESFVKALTIDLNLRILIALNIHKKLSLTKLANYLDKSKATISRRTSALIKLDIIEAIEAENERTPGSIKKKYYSICKDFEDLFEHNDLESFDPSNFKDLVKLREETWRKTYLVSLLDEKICTSLKNLTQKIRDAPQSKGKEANKNFIEPFLEFSTNLLFLSKKQYEELKSIRSEFYIKLKKILSDNDSIKKEYIFADMVLPVLKMKEFEFISD